MQPVQKKQEPFVAAAPRGMVSPLTRTCAPAPQGQALPQRVYGKACESDAQCGPYYSCQLSMGAAKQCMWK